MCTLAMGMLGQSWTLLSCNSGGGDACEGLAVGMLKSGPYILGLRLCGWFYYAGVDINCVAHSSCLFYVKIDHQ